MVHHGILGICHTSRDDRLNPAYLPSHLAVMSGEAVLSCSVRIRDNGLQICSNATEFAVKWSIFRCARESSAYSLSHVMTVPPQHICQSHLALRHSWWYWVIRSEYETWLAYLTQTGNFCMHLIEVQVHRKWSSPYPYDWSITAYLPITVVIKSV